MRHVAIPALQDIIARPHVTARAYAGAGSRKAPYEVGLIIAGQAKLLEQGGFQVRTGYDKGAEAWFCRSATSPDLYSHRDVSGIARLLVNEVHRNPGSLSGRSFDEAASMGTRLFGRSFNEWAAFVLCWTKDGCDSEETLTPETGRTGFLIALADRAGIPVFNLKQPTARDRLKDYLNILPG